MRLYVNNVLVIIFVFGPLEFIHNVGGKVFNISIDEQLFELSMCRECTPRPKKGLLVEPKCVTCMCDLDCIKYGDCCIDVLIKLNRHTTQIDSDFTCVSLQSEGGFSIRNFASSEDGYYMITNFTGTNGERKPCGLDRLLPVSCRETGISYINMECAFLNKDTKCADWIINSECKKGKDQGKPICQSYLDPPPFAELRYCDVHRSKPIVSKCALDLKYNPDRYTMWTELCEKYFYLVYDEDNIVYKNHYCYLCNGKHASGVLGEAQNPVIVLTSFTDQFEKAVYKEPCDGKKAWMDFRVNKCRPIQCYTNKILVDGYCVTENKTALGNRYYLMDVLELSTTKRVPILTQAITNVMTYLSFGMFSTKYQLTASRQVYGTTQSYVYLNIWFTIDKNITVDDFEEYIFTLGSGRFPRFANLSIFYTVNYSELVHSQPLYKTFKSDEESGLCCSVEDTLEILDVNEYEPITNQLSCAYIVFDQGEFSVVNMTAFVDHLNLTLDRGDFSVYNGKLTVCFETFLEQTGFVYNNGTIMYTVSKEPSIHSTISWYLTIVCITLSMVSLLLAFITYVRFPEMRTQPGINNMGLTINLFSAQLMLMVGVDQVDKPVLCQGIGMIIHYFWLSMLFWMNICSYHMFKVFVHLKLRLPSKGVAQTIKYAAYGNGTSLLVVIATVLVNLQLSGGRHLGYGGDVCYLSSKLLVAYCFVLPLCIVIVSNCIFFLWTVISIHRVKQTGKQTGERNNIYIYIKLSVVTGVFWIFSILSNVVNSQIMIYIAIILNGLQGVFLLWSFILNRTVLLKWKTKLLQTINTLSGEATTTSELQTN